MRVDAEQREKFLQSLRDVQSEVSRLVASTNPSTKSLVEHWLARLRTLETFLTDPNGSWLDAPDYVVSLELDYDKPPPDFVEIDKSPRNLLHEYSDVRRRTLRSHYRHWSRRWQWWNWRKWQ